MRYASITAFCAAALIATAASARIPEARNPFHCGIALQVAYDLVRKAHGPDSALAGELQGRIVWQSFAAARFPKALDSEVEGDALRRTFIADPQATVAMAEACMIRQDAHPQFREARLEKQLREGLTMEPASERASIEALKGLLRPTRPASRAE